MKLFKYEDYSVKVEPEALLLAPFKAIYDRDKSALKAKAFSELAFIYFMVDPRSDYQYIVDAEERQKEIIAGEGMSSKWKPDKLVKKAMEFYESFKPTSAGLLEDTRVAINKVREFLRNVNLTATDDKGKPLYTLNSITATIKMIPQLIKDLDTAEKVITSDMLAQDNGVRGQKEKSILEDLDM